MLRRCGGGPRRPPRRPHRRLGRAAPPRGPPSPRPGLGRVGAGCRILTHCTTGALVSAGEGTAFAIILAAHRAGRVARLWVDETRPLLQGARLTAYEAGRAGIPHAVLADSAAASLMAAGEGDLVLTRADRIAADRSVANQVGHH